MNMSLESLIHPTCDLPGGGFVLFLETGALIDAEAEAMLQALHSRSIGGIKAHLKKLASKGVKDFMAQFYVGYGHKSIGDCGTGTIFIEGVSMLAAKAIQDWMLYAGQEASTRYIDFSTQAFLNPGNTDLGAWIQESWRVFYLRAVSQLEEHLNTLHPRQEGEDEGVYKKAIKARAFDVARAFLPAGATTNLAWHSNLRQFADHMMHLRHHPLEEVREVTRAIEVVCNQRYPNSFGHKRYDATEKYNEDWMNSDYYFTPHEKFWSPDVRLVMDSVDRGLLSEYEGYLPHPPKTELPKQMAECGTMRFEFLLDFGSFRDIQRQRSIVQRMPLLTTDYDIHPWYWQQLPEKLIHELDELISKQGGAILGLGICDPTEKQYYIPMGYQVPCRISGDLPALVYVTELRASKMVHPTLHERALQLADVLLERFGSLGLNLHIDREMGRFDIKRGTHDIVERKATTM